MFPLISIDGPAASGKSSVAQRIASTLGIMFVSSGELYRAVTWAALEAGVSPESNLAAFLSQIKISSEEHSGKIVFLMDGKDVTQYLKDEPVNRNVSFFSRISKFRLVLLEPLRDLGNRFSLVMEGRDIGSVVFPNTPYKFYLDASEQERRRRRATQKIIDAVEDRDRLDSTRKTAPLLVPVGACVIDTTCLGLDEVVDQILKSLKKQKFPKGIP